ncbi:hypothetical protein TNCV_3137741 [Trichonephila clavipes]|nr:hypothetical protein TNCV_3137741 [Trichonephila clavipes]
MNTIQKVSTVTQFDFLEKLETRKSQVTGGRKRAVNWSSNLGLTAGYLTPGFIAGSAQSLCLDVVSKFEEWRADSSVVLDTKPRFSSRGRPSGHGHELVARMS